MSRPERSVVKLTPWFPPSIDPVHIGVYECGKPFGGPWFRYWDGYWRQGDAGIREAYDLRNNPSAFVPCLWRGLVRSGEAAERGA